MSLSPHVAHLRAGQKMGDLKMIDSMAVLTSCQEGAKYPRSATSWNTNFSS